MSVVINGDTGISGVNGHAGAPALKGSDADSGIHFGTDTASISTGGTNRLHVDANGNVGVGTTSVDFSDFGSNTGGVSFQDIGGTNTGLKIGDGTNHNYLIAAGNGSFYQSHYGSGSMIFGVGEGTGTERMRLTNSGNLLLNGAEDMRIELGAHGTSGGNDKCHVRADGETLKLNCAGQGNIIFEENGNQRLLINTNGSTSINATTLNDTTAFIGGHRFYDKALSTTRDGVAAGAMTMQAYYSGGPTCFEMNQYFGDNHPTNGQRYMYFDLVSSNVHLYGIKMEVYTGGWSYGATVGYVCYWLANNRNTVSSTAITEARTAAMPHLPKIKNQSSTVCRVGIDANGGTSNVVYIKMTSTFNLLNMIDSTVHFTDVNPF